ncbi:MAG: tetratricopeptide repeat protein [Hyphomicrobiaceae bacterium]
MNERWQALGRDQVRGDWTRARHYPSIAVLPFRVAPDAGLTRYFADGVSTDIAGCLARMPELRVIGASSPLPWRGPRVEPGEVAKVIGAHYILTGQINRHDQRLTFSQKLFDARANEAVWTDKVEANIDELFEIQRRIVARVVNGIVPQLRQAEIQRAMLKTPESLTPYDMTLRAIPDIRGLKQKQFEAARELLKAAASCDPGYAMPIAWLARSCSLKVGQGWATDRAGEAAEGIKLANEAIKLDPTNSLALGIAAHMHSFLLHDYDTALALYDQAVEACHNDAFVWSYLSATLVYLGRTVEARQAAEWALQLSPFDECIHQLYFANALACYGDADYEAAETWSRKALSENANYTVSYRILIAALVGQGRVIEACDVAHDLRRLEPTFRVVGGRNIPIKDPIIRERYFKHLRAAGALDPDPR